MQSFHRIVLQLLTIATLAGSQAQTSGPVTSAIDSFIEAQEISGAVTLVARHGEIVHLEANGDADITDNRQMKRDNLFWIASMTKPFTGAAILLLQDQGKLSTDDLVEQHLSEFTDLWLIDQKSPNEQSLKRPTRKITLKDLLTHTSGVPNISIPRAHSTLGEVVSLVSQQPLQFEPGSRWSYSNTGMDTLGHIVEVISGQSFDEFLNAQFFKPLGMRHTSFHPSKRQSSRLAKTYQKDKETGALTEAEIHILKAPLWDRQRTVRPAGGLFLSLIHI